MSWFDPTGSNASGSDQLDPETALKLAKMLQNAQAQTPTANTPFGGAANAGGQLLNAYLQKQLALQYDPVRSVAVTAQRTPDQAMSSMGYDWQKIKNMFNFLGGG